MLLQVHVIELGPYKLGNFAPRNCYDHLHFLDDLERYDFPVSLQVMLLCDLLIASCVTEFFLVYFVQGSSLFVMMLIGDVPGPDSLSEQ